MSYNVYEPTDDRPERKMPRDAITGSINALQYWDIQIELVTTAQAHPC